MLGEREANDLAQQMCNWELTGTLANPPNVTRISPKLVHIRQYVMDVAYVPPYTTAETRNAFKRRIYDVLMHMEAVKHNPPQLHIERKFPGTHGGAYGTISTHPRCLTR
jgi:hypothetical protein